MMSLAHHQLFAGSPIGRWIAAGAVVAGLGLAVALPSGVAQDRPALDSQVLTERFPLDGVETSPQAPAAPEASESAAPQSKQTTPAAPTTEPAGDSSYDWVILSILAAVALLAGLAGGFLLPERPWTWWRLHSHGVLASALALAVVVTIVATAMTPWGRRQLSLSFTRPPSPSVELYFDRENPVRQQLVKGGTRLVVRFAVRTSDSPNSRYAYRLTVATKRTPRIIRQGVVITTADSVAFASPSIVIPTLTGWSSVEIQLLGRSEYLRWLNSTRAG